MRAVCGHASIATRPRYGGSGRAWGKQTGANGYDDSQATLHGITNPNVRAEAIIYKDAAIGAENHEIEICLRTVEGSTWTKKYEFLWNAAGNVSIGKWLGNDGAGGGHTFTDFPGLAPIEGFHQYGTPSTGTRIIAQAFNIGPSTVRLRAWVQHPGDPSPRLVQESIDDGTSGAIEGGASNTPAYMAGSPGIGGYINSPSSNLAHFAFQSFEVRVISDEDEPL